MKDKIAWGILERSENRLDGKREWLSTNDWCSDAVVRTRLFATRQEARKVCDKEFGYIKERADLRAEPHGWKTPKIVKVKVTIEVMER